MIPANFVGLVLFALALAPGWAWVRVAERREVRPPRSPLLEAAELVVTGVVFTSAAALVVVSLASQLEWIPDLGMVTARDSTFLQDEPYRAASTAAAVFLLSMMGALGGARFLYRGKDASLRPAGSVWRDVFGEGGSGRPIFVSATLVDDRVVEGRLYSYSTDAEGGDRDLALQPPIRVWAGTPPQLVAVKADRAILRSDQIAALWVRYEWDRSGNRQANSLLSSRLDSQRSSGGDEATSS